MKGKKDSKLLMSLGRFSMSVALKSFPFSSPESKAFFRPISASLSLLKPSLLMPCLWEFDTGSGAGAGGAGSAVLYLRNMQFIPRQKNMSPANIQKNLGIRSSRSMKWSATPSGLITALATKPKRNGPIPKPATIIPLTSPINLFFMRNLMEIKKKKKNFFNF